MTRNKLAIKLDGVSKVYQLHHEKPTFVENIFSKNKFEKFVALNDISLEIKQGEKVGIIGHNGSGKTTLLKVICGITTPNKGKVKTWGKVVSLIDLSAGFHPELTGIENVYQNSMLIGMSREETKSKMKEITEFSGIHGFIDAPMYTYSAGMQLRLGFAIAVAADPDILILDEGIGVGDEDFQRKSSEKIEEFFKKRKTIIIVSHWLEYLEIHCPRIIWFENGKIKADGGKGLIRKYAKK